MPKRLVEVCIESDKKEYYKTTALIKEDNIIYKEKDNTLVTFNKKDNILLRKNNDIEMKYNFTLGKETTGTIKILELNKIIEININTISLIKEEDFIKIEYQIENNTFKYSINMKNK